MKPSKFSPQSSQTLTLSQILAVSKEHRNNALFVFDLDSTLFDVSPRLEKILLNFADLPETQRLFPDSVPFLKSVKTQRTDWGIKNALIRAGLDNHHPEFHLALKDFWLHSFFSHEYLEYDEPYEGAVEYVGTLFQHKSQIVYLSGRDVQRMGVGSERVLKKWNFPVGMPNAELVLKPQAGLDDAEFKRDWFRAQPLNQYERIFFFENEPKNIELIDQSSDLEKVEMVFFDSTHAGVAASPTHLPRIFHYLIDSEGT